MRPELQQLPEPNWFNHGAQILGLLDDHRPIVCVELGSNRGCSAIATARLIRQWRGNLTCVDRWVPSAHGEVALDVFVANVAAAGVAATIRMVCADTTEAARQWVGLIDYLYVDAGHTHEQCSRDLEAWWPFVRIGGLVAGDDYDDPDGSPQDGVTRAWDEFEARHGQRFYRTSSDGVRGRLVWGIRQ